LFWTWIVSFLQVPVKPLLQQLETELSDTEISDISPEDTDKTATVERKVLTFILAIYVYRLAVSGSLIHQLSQLVIFIRYHF
jgi:hypothetical protein